jgi:ABC-type antimicrobial peptide transport system permease subunit
VVTDAITERLHEQNVLAVYEPLDRGGEPFAQLLLRVAPGASTALPHVSQRLGALDPHATVAITSIAARLEQETNRPRMLATLTAVVGVVAIALCVIGLHGLTSSVVGQRTREMGVRVAMGAAPRDLLRLLLWDSLRPVTIGLIVGSGAALLASRAVVSAMFFGISPQDPAAFVGAAAILAAAATSAVVVPTRRAASTDAGVALRQR